MQAQELRIGNWVAIDDLPIEQVTLELFATLKEHPNTLSLFKPIPLTEEWLIKFGFENDGNDNYKIKGIRYNVYKPVDYVGYLFCENRLVLREIKHVHQLQNLYFALTGSELKLKQ